MTTTVTNRRTDPLLALGLEMRVGPAGDYCNFSTYGTSPENPARTRLAFTRFPSAPASSHKAHDAEVWTCGLDGSAAVLLARVTNLDPHNGARADWIDDDTLLYFDNFRTKVRRLDGTLLHDKPGYPGERAHGEWALVFHPELAAPDEGLYALNVRTGEYRLLLSCRQLRSLGPGRLTHPRFNPDGTRVGFCLGDDFYSVSSRDGADPLRLGPAPMHWLWYDAATIVGHTSSWGLGTRCSLDGAQREVVSGLGNHLAIAPGGRLFASDTDYGSTPVVLTLFRHGETTGTPVFSSDFADAVWKFGHAHSNPSFARDGSRVYYSKSTGPNLIQAFYRNITKEN